MTTVGALGEVLLVFLIFPDYHYVVYCSGYGVHGVITEESLQRLL